jgi:pyruvate dehydrogenase E2 component (dihydrolipoamide acetyltransferase)
MAVEIRVPRLGWTMEEGIFRGWLKEDGAHIKSGEPIFVLEGEKTAQEIEATEDGVLKIDPAGPGDGSTVVVGALIGHLLAEGEKAELEAVAMEPDDRGGVDPVPAKAHQFSATQPPRETDSSRPRISAVALTISPRAARTAAALGVDWTKIRGTGRTGRIRERDVLAAASSQNPSGNVQRGR